ncbi:YlxR family protein [Microcella flavibacter]|uniref:YlxR family protein n=1 Tax=Microcella flavibacter TaxID=1804990 RepID=UPI0014575C53|nr:YlxR family protein [Microcella flavibacter]
MEPVRTCIGCRRRAPQSSLMRVVARGETAVPDSPPRSPGRGAWVHATRDCIETATSRRAFGRALRVTGPLDAAPVLAVIGSVGSPREQADRPMDN